MKTLFFFLFLASALSASELQKEAFFICEKLGQEGTAKVMVDPQIFCDDLRVHQATLILSSQEKTETYDGELLRWESGKGESFIYPGLGPEEGKKLSLTVPYGVAVGVLAQTQNGETVSSLELKCVTKQIHVDCD